MSKRQKKMESRQVKVYPKTYFVTKAVGDRTFTVCGKVDRFNDVNAMRRIDDGEGRFIVVPDNKHVKMLSVGWSICCADDAYNKEFGVSLALSRCKERPLAKMYSDYNGEFREDTVRAILQARLDYLITNYEKFLPGARENR